MELEKVSFNGKNVTAGLMATTHIQHTTYLLTTSILMLNNLFIGAGLSEIEFYPSQLGPLGQRLILGPFRFANHD